VLHAQKYGYYWKIKIGKIKLFTIIFSGAKYLIVQNAVIHSKRKILFIKICKIGQGF